MSFMDQYWVEPYSITFHCTMGMQSKLKVPKLIKYWETCLDLQKIEFSNISNNSKFAKTKILPAWSISFAGCTKLTQIVKCVK